MLNALRKLFSGSNTEGNSGSEDNQLWIMIKENDFFREDSSSNSR
ncbi:hypothetical protein [Pseudoalteromonas sp. 1_2015MBL_MicDiv]|nr:hypothetical protein [Pseudoalteromonas sp. 1_2015MBL_MicDiv]